MRAAKSLLMLAVAATASAKTPCPIYGPIFPKPSNMRNHPRTKAAREEIDKFLADGIESMGDQVHLSYGSQVFSTDEGELWSRYWQPPSFASLNTTGLKKAGPNAVHRVGSITKLFTVYTFLATIGDSVSSDPITKYIPELKAIADRSKKVGTIYAPEWDEITVGSLMSHQSGLTRDYSLLGELLADVQNRTQLFAWGFPDLAEAETPPCNVYNSCTRKQFLEGLSKQIPYHAPYHTAMYNDIAYTLLSYVAESITGKPFMSLIEETVIKPLGLNYTFTYAPDHSLGLFPDIRDQLIWPMGLGTEAPGGNMYSSVGDLAKLCRSIMNSTLLRPALTRQWLKPTSFLPDPHSAVGMPWGIRQLSLVKNTSYQYVTSFNKAGRAGGYAAFIAILPALDLGWSVVTAGRTQEDLTLGFADKVSNTFMDAYLDIAREQAQVAYGGTYAHPTLPINITINTQSDAPGMGIVSWMSNGTDMKMFGVAFETDSHTDEEMAKLQTSARMYPTGLEDKLPDGGKKVSFRVVFEDLNAKNLQRNYATDCATWIYSNAMYGSMPLDILIFTLDKNGKAVAVESPALRVTMQKKSDD